MNNMRLSTTMRMLKYLPLILIMFLIALPGCKERKESDRITIRFVSWKPNQPEVWKEILGIFEKENPDIRVIREIGPHSSTAFHDLLTQKLKNKSRDVDVFFMDVIWPPEFAAAGWALPLDGMFPQSERRKFLDGTIIANTYKNRIYGVPLFIDSGMLFYRKDLLDEYGFQPPITWNEMVKQAGEIVKKEKQGGSDIYGFSGQFKQYEGLVCNMMEYILSNGGRIIKLKTGKSGLTEKPALDAVRFVRDRIIGKIAPEGVLTYQEPESLDLFIQGKAVFLRSWPYAWTISNDPEKSRIAGKVGIAKLPHFKGGKSYSALGGWQLGISSYSNNIKAAWRFVRFLTSNRIQKLYAMKAGKAPTRKSLYNDPGILNMNPHFAYMKDVFISAYPRPVSPLYPSISNILQRYFSKAVSDPNSDIEKEAASASREIDRIIALTK
ncbi:putative ABC transporter-binding protein precursor [bacterium BMS3Abin07]|nr:putative ABC transporter-binding protein precursor [bacterium BMS3Abin07]GBE32906.1 putative ABC transporter-binding protein precursor [bacterium BMS3Bbin05]